jgi:hypothetical protein
MDCLQTNPYKFPDFPEGTSLRHLNRFLCFARNPTAARLFCLSFSSALLSVSKGRIRQIVLRLAKQTAEALEL